MTWARLRANAAEILPALAANLATETWQPAPLRTVVIPTYTGKRMDTVIPTAADRVVHRALRNAVEPVLEARAFADWVSGYRPRRNRITAVRQARAYLETGYRWATDIDVESVSDGAGVEEAVGWFAEHVHDGTFLAVLRTALAGLPTPIVPGSGLAPLMINLRLARVDRRLRDLRVVRFADNYCAFSRSKDEAEGAFFRISDALAGARLVPNSAKSRIRSQANAEDLFLIGG